MPISAWIMLVVASLILYGGLIACIVIAIRKSSSKREKGNRNKA